jgi:cellulose 1,4-beta-cellobiosidase
MPADGGLNEYPLNKAGAKYGTGYCDAQCPHDIKFINGEANTMNWNNGKGLYGTCCSEMDIWEANKMSSAYTPHPCSVKGLYRCNGTSCGDINRYGGVCDKDGCDFNSYRMGIKDYYGEGMIIDTKRPFSVITQFITTDGTSKGDLKEIKRFYKQDGKIIPNSKSDYSGKIKPYDSISDSFCEDQKNLFNDVNDFAKKGGLKTMGESLERGVVLVLSLWDDHEAYMLWLDSNYPADRPSNMPGVARGSCSIQSGRPDDVEKNYPNSNVKFMNIRYGDIGSTF